MADEKSNETHLFANDGTDWTSSPSPVKIEDKAKEDAKVDKAARAGQGPSATNEPR